jgi:NAD(P)-dependent dehydrogenase (short-subunit alcohol dehydrogenase family)
MDMRERVIVVTGASSGIGNACATFLAKKGAKVYGTCRAPSSYTRKADEFFEMLQMDVEDDASVAKAAGQLLAKEKGIDALVCCAGSAFAGSVEDSTIDDARRMMEINYLGALRVVKAFLPRMREVASGRIVLAGALEGIMGAPYQALYSASKFALEGLAESLRMEARDFGVDVSVFEPSCFRTSFGQRRELAASAESGPYRKRLDAVLSSFARDEAVGASPLAAAKAVFALLSSRRMPRRAFVGGGTQRLLAELRPFLSARARERARRKHFRLE